MNCGHKELKIVHGTDCLWVRCEQCSVQWWPDYDNGWPVPGSTVKQKGVDQ